MRHAHMRQRQRHNRIFMLATIAAAIFIIAIWASETARQISAGIQNMAMPAKTGVASAESGVPASGTSGNGNSPSNAIDNITSQPGAQPAENAENPLGVTLNSTNALLIAIDGEWETLLDIRSREKIHPASMTKIMTAVVALENLPDYDEKITLGNTTFGGAVTAGFQPGEEVRAIDLLYGLMLPSGAECAVGLAERVAGSETAFADMMNAKASELAMDGTRFTNATGLHDDGHYSTVYDIALLLDYALKNETFHEIFTTKRHSTPPTNIHEGGITYYSSLLSKISAKQSNSYKILGGKTGYTEQAGQCLASLAEKGGTRYILVTAGAPAKNNYKTLHIDDALAVFDAV